MTDEKIMATIKPDGECWQPEIEKMPREQLRELQVKKLKESINVALKSPFYKKKLGDLGITADSIETPEDIRKLPFTTKQDLRENYPFGLVGGNMDDAIRIHSTSGTTGHPTVVTYSEHDICSWANMIARDMYMVGCRKSDVFQNSSGYGMFTGGLGFQHGAEWLGTRSVRSCSSRTSVLLVCTPFLHTPSVWPRCSKRKALTRAAPSFVHSSSVLSLILRNNASALSACLVSRPITRLV